MIETAKQREVRIGYIGIDGGYGKDPRFLRGIDNLGHTFVADVHCRQMIYHRRPDAAYSGLERSRQAAETVESTK